MFPVISDAELLAFLALVGAFALTCLLAILKLCGVLLMSWGTILAPVPVAIVLVVFCVAIRSF